MSINIFSSTLISAGKKRNEKQKKRNVKMNYCKSVNFASSARGQDL